MTETLTTSSTGGQKGVKPARVSLLPAYPLMIVAEHYGKGAEKYAAHNWRKGYEFSKAADSLGRHFLDWLDGNDEDEDGYNNLAAVVFHAFSLIQFGRDFPEFDDRYKTDVSDYHGRHRTEDLSPFEQWRQAVRRWHE